MNQQVILPNKTKSQRLLSLDAFRGFTIMAMIIVNSPGSWSHIFPPLKHAEWNGVTLADLVFPFFLFIVGMSVALAYSQKRDANYSKSKVFNKVLYRAMKIFFLGIFLAIAIRGFQDLRVAGVLQRIALVFVTLVILFFYTEWKTQVYIGSGILVVYWLAMYFIPLPHLGYGVVEPGRNIAAFVDSFLLPGSMYFKTWDPEGLLSTLPAISTGISGLLIGQLMFAKMNEEKKLNYLFLIGFLTLIAGIIWSWHFPFNKSIWSSSYVLFTSGFAIMTLAVLYFFMDIKGKKKWANSGVVFGSNAITAYVLHGLMVVPCYIWTISENLTLSQAYMNGMMSIGLHSKIASFSWAILYTAVCYLPIWVLYKKKIFLKV